MGYVETLLDAYHTLKWSDDIECRHLLMDLENALRSAELSGIELRAIRILYIDEPSAPTRDRINKSGNTRGRPSGGTSQGNVALQLFPTAQTQNAARMRFIRVKKRALSKLADVLGYDKEYNGKLSKKRVRHLPGSNQAEATSM